MKPIKSKPKEPAISGVLSVVAILCFISSAGALLLAALYGQLILVAAAAGSGVAGFLLIAISEIVIRLDRIAIAVESTAALRSIAKAEADRLSGGFQ